MVIISSNQFIYLISDTLIQWDTVVSGQPTFHLVEDAGFKPEGVKKLSQFPKFIQKKCKKLLN